MNHTRANSTSETNVVWDLPLRVFHWLLVVAFVLSYLSANVGGEWLYWHISIGLFILALIVFRLCWGFVGSETSLFKSFFPTYKRMDHCYFSVTPVAGHSPHGAVAVFSLLLLLCAQVVTGLFAFDDDIDIAGPFYIFVDDSVAESLSALHSQIFDVLLIVVAIHIAAIFIYRILSNSKLTMAMITGNNPDVDSAPKALYTKTRLTFSVLLPAILYFGINYFF